MISDLKYQIFVSSTFEDLQSERRAVMEQILNLNSIPVGMELFQAGDDDQWTYIQRRIVDCDYYLVLIAERYGSTNKHGISYTEMEYRFAIENKIPVAAFLLEENARKSWPRDKVEYASQEKLRAFRDLCKTKMVRYWSSEHDLAAKVTTCLIELSRIHPRTGWIRADKGISPAIATELARLSKENDELRERAKSSSRDLEKCASAVRMTPFSHVIAASIKYYRDRHPEVKIKLGTTVTLAEFLKNNYKKLSHGVDSLSLAESISEATFSSRPSSAHLKLRSELGRIAVDELLGKLNVLGY